MRLNPITELAVLAAAVVVVVLGAVIIAAYLVNPLPPCAAGHPERHFLGTTWCKP